MCEVGYSESESPRPLQLAKVKRISAQGDIRDGLEKVVLREGQNTTAVLIEIFFFSSGGLRSVRSFLPRSLEKVRFLLSRSDGRTRTGNGGQRQKTTTTNVAFFSQRKSTRHSRRRRHHHLTFLSHSPSPPVSPRAKTPKYPFLISLTQSTI